MLGFREYNNSGLPHRIGRFCLKLEIKTKLFFFSYPLKEEDNQFFSDFRKTQIPIRFHSGHPLTPE